jgi:hypothetical protein
MQGIDDTRRKSVFETCGQNREKITAAVRRDTSIQMNLSLEVDSIEMRHVDI